MARIFTLYPAGAPGLGLLLLRIASSIFLLHAVVNGELRTLPAIGAGVLALGLSLGLLTQMAAGLGSVVAVALAIEFSDALSAPLAGEVLVLAAIGLLGPGAYSMDAVMFGRRTVRPVR